MQSCLSDHALNYVYEGYLNGIDCNNSFSALASFLHVLFSSDR